MNVMMFSTLYFQAQFCRLRNSVHNTGPALPCNSAELCPGMNLRLSACIRILAHHTIRATTYDALVQHPTMI